MRKPKAKKKATKPKPLGYGDPGPAWVALSSLHAGASSFPIKMRADGVVFKWDYKQNGWVALPEKYLDETPRSEEPTT